jgi:ribosomal protein S18 acetylase RimI-like enzyme
MFQVRRCRLRDVGPLSDLLRVCWHATYDSILGEVEATRLARYMCSKVNLGITVAFSRVFARSLTLVATKGTAPIGYAMAQRDEQDGQIILYGLYVHPEWQGKGIGSALVEAVVAKFPGAERIRLEVLKGNDAAIAWYQRRGFEAYGETPFATGTDGIAALYMDKQLSQPDPSRHSPAVQSQ